MHGDESYSEWLAAYGLSKNTIRQRLAFRARLIDQWGTLDQPPHVVVDWLTGFQGWTRRTYLAHLKSIYAWMLVTGQIQASPVARMRTPPTPPPRPRPLSAAELTRVLEASTGHMTAWLLLGAMAGLRCHEIAKVAGQDIDERQLYVLGKGGHEAVLPTHPLLWDLAQSYPRDGHWFPSVQGRREYVSTSHVGNHIRAHFRACGIEGDGAVHRLRYSFGTNLARSGAQMRVVQELLRHKSLETTMRYVAVDADERIAAIRNLAA